MTSIQGQHPHRAHRQPPNPPEPKAETPADAKLRGELSAAGVKADGSSLSDAVKAFQRDHNAKLGDKGVALKVDGIAGPKTRAALDARLRPAATAAPGAAAAAAAAAAPVTKESQDAARQRMAADPTAQQLATRANQALPATDAKATAPAAEKKDADAEQRRAILGKDYRKASKPEIRELQDYLSAHDYDVGAATGTMNGKTKKALDAARHRQTVLDAYGDTSSRSADLVRGISPFPKNVTNVAASVMGLDTAITNNSLNPDEQRVVFDTVENAIRRSGKTAGAADYKDYGDPKFQEYFNRGNIPAQQMVEGSVNDPKFRMASLMGRSSYLVDPEDPDKVYVMDRYDWNKGEANFSTDGKTVGQSIVDNVREGDWENLGPDTYKAVRNWLRSTDDGSTPSNNRAFLVFSRREMAARAAAAAQAPTAPEEPELVLAGP